METGRDEYTSIDLNGKFLHTLLFIELLVNSVIGRGSNKHNIEQFLTLCTREYEGVDTTQQIIQEFSKSYSSEQAAWWYTRDSFLYASLNKAFRVQNIDFLIAVRFFVQDLNAQLCGLQQAQSFKPVRVYRSQLMSSNEVAIFYKSIGNLILVPSFLSTSLSRQYTLFLLGDSHAHEGLERVLFEIDADPGLDCGKPFADITEKSYFPNESEILFSLGSIFRIVNVHRETDGIHVIQMTLCCYDDESTKPLFEFMKKDVENATSIYVFGLVLLKSGHFDAAQRIFLQTLIGAEGQGNEQLISTCFHNIGIARAETKDFELSIKFLNKSLEIESRLLPKNNPSIATILVNIGNILRRLGKLSEAFESYTKALDILRIAYTDEEHEDFARCYNGMANVCTAEAKYEKAVELYRKAHWIKEKIFPSYHPSLALSYSNMGYLHQLLGQYDQALTNKEYALSIQVKSLPPEHLDFADTYSNMAVLLGCLWQNQKALEFFEKAASIIRKHFPSTHEAVLNIEKNIDGAKHRLTIEALQAEARSKSGSKILSTDFKSPLNCGGRACSKCGNCSDWNHPSGRYIKRPDAYCRFLYSMIPDANVRPPKPNRPFHLISVGTRDNPLPGAAFLCNCKDRDWF
ncbi:unnamed protein product [Rotaria socialis]|uniref:Uncharacterized protein n=1 Tax=Rotaria socialis TaxID=392032 RepID=A0A821S324_9BILA|nr:unnamed protein product [Rotaria socialis]CAF4850024.1 unnamed protein product [Rotaria socialis]